MPAIDKQCSIFNAYNFKRDLQDKIGHVTYLKIGENELVKDQELKIPLDDSLLKVVGPIGNFHWEGGYAQPLLFTIQLSITNKNAVAALLHTTMQSVAVVIAFNIYDYDPIAKKFFRCLHSNDVNLNSIIYMQGRERQIYLQDEPSAEVTKPLNFQLTLGVIAEDTQQEIHLAVSLDRKFVKPWGVTRG